MIWKAIAVVLFFASGFAFILWIMSHVSDVAVYQSTTRYCFRLYTAGGRTSLHYDGAVLLPPFWQGSFDFGGLRYRASTGAWQYVNLSSPSWLAGGLLALYPSFVFLRPPIRRRIRRRRGWCLWCGYDLTGNVTGMCSECGEAILPTERQRRLGRLRLLITVLSATNLLSAGTTYLAVAGRIASGGWAFVPAIGSVAFGVFTIVALLMYCDLKRRVARGGDRCCVHRGA